MSAARLRVVERDQWQMWAHEWARHLRARNVSAQTAKVYLQAVDNLAEWARAQGIEDPTALRRRHVESYLADFAERKNRSTGKPLSPAYVAKDFRSLRVFFKYLAEEEDMPSPMDKVARPIVPAKRTSVFTEDDLRKLLAACEGRGFAARRDTAMLRVLFDAGLRRAEIMGLAVADVDLDSQTLRVVYGKGRKLRMVGIGLKTTEALSRYLRTRSRHPDADHPALWLADPVKGHSGALGVDALRLMLGRRSRQAGVENVHPHRFRHTAFDLFADAGGSGGDAMKLFGWSSRSMLDHYAASSAERRALSAHKRLSPGDRI